MLDRQKVEAILSRRFPGAPRNQVAAAANAIMGLPDEWEEVLHGERQGSYHFSHDCGGLCQLTETGAGEPGIEFRLFTRRHA
jgi:hypothetical protein